MNWESLPPPADSVLKENRNLVRLPPGFHETYAVLIDGVVRCKKCYEPKAVLQPQTLLRHAAKKTCVATKKPSAIYVNSPHVRDLREKFSLKLSDLKRKLKKKLPSLVKEHAGTKYDQESFMALVQQILERRFYLGRSHPMVYEDLWPDEMNSVKVLMGLKNNDYNESIDAFHSKASLASPVPVSRGITPPVLEPARATSLPSTASTAASLASMMAWPPSNKSKSKLQKNPPGDLMAQSMLQNAKKTADDDITTTASISFV